MVTQYQDRAGMHFLRREYPLPRTRLLWKLSKSNQLPRLGFYVQLGQLGFKSNIKIIGTSDSLDLVQVRWLYKVHSISSYQILVQNLFSSFSSEEPWICVLLDLCVFLISFFPTPYSRANFLYLHQFASCFFSIES